MNGDRMSATREALLRPELKIPATAIKWYFTHDHYDGPISGLAVYRTQIVQFCCFPEDIGFQSVFVLQELTEAELTEAKRVKAKFERMVSTRSSFDEQGKPLADFLADEESRNRYYSEEPAGQSPTPADRPIIAWFDLAE